MEAIQVIIPSWAIGAITGWFLAPWIDKIIFKPKKDGETFK